MGYTVWLFTRPLSYASLFPAFEFTSQGRDQFRHWGVLVSELTLLDAQIILLRNPQHWDTEYDSPLGTMYDLFRDEDSQNNVHITRPFEVATIQRDWRAVSVQYVGETNMTFEMIDKEGTASLSAFCFVRFLIL